MNLVQSKLDRIEKDIKNVFEDFFTPLNYYSQNSITEDLHLSGNEFPLLPYVKVIWENKNQHRKLVFKVFTNYITFIEIINTLNGNKLKINDYKKMIGINIEISDTKGNKIDKQFINFLKKNLELINQGELLDVLKGNKWIEVPFDWQNQK